MNGACSRITLARIIDANVNRAFEGLRVCEDLLRFSTPPRSSWRQLRALRHALSTEVARLPMSLVQQLAARDSARDPGHVARPSSSRVRSLNRLLLINLQRAKEALRVLEETSRVVAPRQVAAFQCLRFRLYDVERNVLLHLAPVRHR